MFHALSEAFSEHREIPRIESNHICIKLDQSMGLNYITENFSLRNSRAFLALYIQCWQPHHVNHKLNMFLNVFEIGTLEDMKFALLSVGGSLKKARFLEGKSLDTRQLSS